MLRCHLQLRPGGLDRCGPLRPQLAPLLPELDDPAGAHADGATLHEALRCAFANVAAAGPTIVVLDDLHWSDEATLEVLAALAEPVRELRLLVIGAYRSDGLPRDHGIRRLRHELRRAGLLQELALAPLAVDETGALLEHALGDRPAHTLVRAIHERTEGVPFFVEELAASMLVSGALRRGASGTELSGARDVPLPETVRDAVLVRTRELSAGGRAAAEVAAVAGEAFDLDLVARLTDEAGLSELIEQGIVLERGDRGRFRHALMREALYADVPGPSSSTRAAASSAASSPRRPALGAS